jgi:RimJ/RimL family protein N-acetyltransferase
MRSPGPVSLLTPDALPALHGHFARHSRENGAEGEPIFSPIEGPREVPFERFEATRRESWARATSEPAWERCWGLWHEGELRGHLLLRQAPPLATALHRATLEMGLERDARGRGHGSALLEAALAWARATPGLAWIDLGVFANNARAHALYARVGFVENGRREDFFRVHGEAITDVSMSLRLR